MKILYKYLAACVLVVTSHACKKELGALPKNEKVDANTILDQSTAQIALNGIYYCFANATVLKTGWQNHQIVPSRLAGHMISNSGIGNEDQNINAKLSSYYWNESYVLLNAANGVLKGVKAVNDNKFVANRKKEIIAEAHFLRAYGHFKLLSYYGEWYKINSPYGALLRDELSTLSNISKPRSTVKDSYDFILADLDDVIANGPVTNPNYYVTKWAGMALKMRVLMSRGLATDYLEIVNLANSIKTKTDPYVLEAKAEDIFHKNGLSSKEVILGLKPQALQEKDYYSKSAQYWPGASSLYVATAKFKELLNNDPRQSWMIGTSNPGVDAPNTFYFTKYMIQNGVPTQISETDYALRLTEVYLLEAEAIARSGGSILTVKTLLHQVQEKAGITATTNNIPYQAVENANSSTILLEIYKETVKSLIAEDGMEWMALLRQPSDFVKQVKPTITNETQYILPVPKSEFLYNATFGEQNPGYSKN